MNTSQIRERHVQANPALIGDRMLVIFMPDGWAAEMRENDLEYYSLWVDALEDYLGRSEGVLSIRKMDFRRADEVFFGRGLPVNEYTMLFVRGDGRALYIDQPIYDQVYYDYADAFLLGRENDFSIPAVLRMGEFEQTTGPFKPLRLLPLQTRRATQLARPRILPEEAPANDGEGEAVELTEDNMEMSETEDDTLIVDEQEEIELETPTHPAIEETDAGELPGRLSPTPEFKPSPEDIEAGIPLNRRVDEEVESEQLMEPDGPPANEQID